MIKDDDEDDLSRAISKVLKKLLINVIGLFSYLNLKMILSNILTGLHKNETFHLNLVRTPYNEGMCQKIPHTRVLLLYILVKFGRS